MRRVKDGRSKGMTDGRTKRRKGWRRVYERTDSRWMDGRRTDGQTNVYGRMEGRMIEGTDRWTRGRAKRCLVHVVQSHLPSSPYTFYQISLLWTQSLWRGFLSAKHVFLIFFMFLTWKKQLTNELRHFTLFLQSWTELCDELLCAYVRTHVMYVWHDVSLETNWKQTSGPRSVSFWTHVHENKLNLHVNFQRKCQHHWLSLSRSKIRSRTWKIHTWNSWICGKRWQIRQTLPLPTHKK